MIPMHIHEARPDLFTQTAEGVLRIAATRVTLDSIVQAFHDGATPEEIGQDFPALSLAQVYDVLAFYLSHTETVSAYLAEQARHAAAIRQAAHTQHASFVVSLRQRLLARPRGDYSASMSTAEEWHGRVVFLPL
jgi:uncharacterized protein (DUF433 family)